ncbi:hypothetical protein [Halorhodospira sp. 9622]|uniref:hypothetical protein n=1 Tax=Halorhodospira sp. 9622 TaxID=2899136 RepID=UPI001EE98D73|nr:hypothetical protein [Halorhodospira sp. 9622]MCG5539325.1 hypothetical protein [Halorhodospira sp. 9622]
MESTVSLTKIKWMAAAPYLLVMLIVLHGPVLGYYDINIFGVQLSLITLIPYLIFHFVSRNHPVDFVAVHTKHAMSIFLVYLLIFVVLSVSMAVYGFGVVSSDTDLLMSAGVVAGGFALLLWGVVIYALIAGTIGAIRAFKLICPDKTQWAKAEQ